MKALLFFSAFLLLLLQSFSSSSSSSAAAASVSLEETCKRVRHDYTFCVTSLQAVPGMVHSTTTIGGFAAVAVNLTRANYTHNLAKASELLKKAKHYSSSSSDDDEYSSLRLQALESCFAAYKAGLSDLERAMGDLITKSGSTDVDAALVNLSEAWKRPGECEQAFEDRSENIKPLLHKEDALASRLITLSLRITILLVQV